MLVRKFVCFGLLMVLGLSGCAVLRPPKILDNDALIRYKASNRALRQFRNQVDGMIADSSFRPAFFGIHIEDLQTGEVIYSRNAHKLLMPASNMKLFTTSSALTLLGADYRYKTAVYTDGTIIDSVLKGNLYIKGSGDPTISGRDNGGNAVERFENWADALKEAGLRKIDGCIIGDDNIFDDNGIGYSWAWDDLSYYYGAVTSGLSFNDNCMDLLVIPGKNVGDTAQIVVYPEPGYIQIVNQIITVPKDSAASYDFYRTPSTEKVRIFGTISIDSDTVTDWVTVDNPTKFFLATFKSVLQKKGITVNSIADIDELPLQDPDYSKMTCLVVNDSPKMSDIVRTVNKVSQNFYAETLQKTLGVELKHSGRSDSGIVAEEEWFKTIGIDPKGIFIVDGSGLSRHNLVTPIQTVAVLKAMKQGKNAKAFFDSLPIAGVDGTLDSRWKNSPAKGHIFAKTGYIGRVRALSGFVEAKNGKVYVFSIIVNHYPTPTSKINDFQDKVTEMLYGL